MNMADEMVETMVDSKVLRKECWRAGTSEEMTAASMVAVKDMKRVDLLEIQKASSLAVLKVAK